MGSEMCIRDSVCAECRGPCCPPDSDAAPECCTRARPWLSVDRADNATSKVIAFYKDDAAMPCLLSAPIPEEGVCIRRGRAFAAVCSACYDFHKVAGGETNPFREPLPGSAVHALANRGLQLTTLDAPPTGRPRYPNVSSRRPEGSRTPDLERRIRQSQAEFRLERGRGIILGSRSGVREPCSYCIADGRLVTGEIVVRPAFNQPASDLCFDYGFPPDHDKEFEHPFFRPTWHCQACLRSFCRRCNDVYLCPDCDSVPTVITAG